MQFRKCKTFFLLRLFIKQCCSALMLAVFALPASAQITPPGSSLLAEEVGQDVQLMFYLAGFFNPLVFASGSGWYSYEGFTYQYFASSGVYAGVKDGEVFVVGGMYGPDLLPAGNVSSIVTLLQQKTPNLITLSHENMAFEYSDQTGPAAAQFLTLASYSPTGWSLESDVSWITLSRTSGITQNNNNSVISVSINDNASGLSRGKHTATVLVRNLSNQNWSMHLPIVMYVTDTGVEVTQAAADMLDFNVTDMVWDAKNSRFYFSDKFAKRVYQVEAASGLTTRYFEFDKTPERMTISPDGNKLYVALLDHEHAHYQWEEDQSGAIGIINLAAQTSLGYFTVDTDPYDLVINTSGKLVVSSGSGQWTAIKTYDALLGVKTGEAFIRQLSRLSLHPNQKWVFAADTDSSPSDIEKFDITGKGITSLGDSPYHGDHRMDGNVWAAPGGNYVYTRGGDVFLASSMSYITSLLDNELIADLAFDISHNSVVVLTESNMLLRFGLADFKVVSAITSGFVDPQFVEAAGGKTVVVDLVEGQYRLKRF